MSNDTKQTIQQLVEHHFEQNSQYSKRENCAAISASHKLHWANDAGVGIEEVEGYLQEVCEPVEPDSDFTAVPIYRLKPR